MEYLVLYLGIINAFAFASMLIDKRKAQKKAWRISEAVRMTVAAIGGSLGVLLGMYAARHKTRKPKFSIGIPLILLVHILLLLFICEK